MEKRVDLTGFPVNNNPAPVNWRGKIIHVRPLIDITDVITLVNSVIEACYSQERDVMIPEMSDFSFREHVISAYSDIKLPEDAKECYLVLYLTDIYETVLKHANKAQIDAAKRVVEMMLYNMQ